MTVLPNWLGHAALGLLAGTAAGLVHFTTLRWNVQQLANGALRQAVALQIMRLGALGLVFVAMARFGAPALLASAAGLLLARQAIMARVKSEQRRQGQA